MNKENYDYLFKILLIGDTAVGKTSVLLRYVDDVFNSDFKTTIGVDFKIRTFEQDGRTIKLQMWDTAGQDKFRNIVASYYRGAHGIIIMYDVTNRETFENTARWQEESSSYLQEDIPKILVGNKTDLEEQRQVTTEEAEAFASRMGMLFIETSARNNQNVSNAFETMTRSILQKATSVEGKKNPTFRPAPAKPVRGRCCQ